MVADLINLAKLRLHKTPCLCRDSQASGGERGASARGEREGRARGASAMAEKLVGGVKSWGSSSRATFLRLRKKRSKTDGSLCRLDQVFASCNLNHFTWLHCWNNILKAVIRTVYFISSVIGKALTIISVSMIGQSFSLNSFKLML